MMRNRHLLLWYVVTTLELATCFASNSDYSPQFLTYVDQALQNLVQNAFWTEGQWYNMTLGPGKLFGLLYDKPVNGDTTDPTGVYGKSKRKRELPFIYQVSFQNVSYVRC